MKKIVYPMMVMLVSCFIGYKWYQKKTKYIEAKKYKPLCINTKNCERCPYKIECYGIDDNID